AICVFAVAGIFPDHIKPQKHAKVYAVVYLMGFICITISPSPTILAIAIFSFGIGQGGLNISCNALGVEVEQPSGKHLMSLFHGMWSLGCGLGTAINGLWDYLSLPYPLILSIPSVMFCFLLWQLAAPFNFATNTTSDENDALRLPLILLPLMSLTLFCIAMNEGIFGDWSALLLQESKAFPLYLAVMGYSIYALAMVVFRLLGGIIIEHFGYIKSLVTCCLIATLGTMMVVHCEHILFLYVGFFLSGMGYSIIFPIILSLSKNMQNIKQSRVIALISAATYSGILLGPVIIGAIAHQTSLALAFSTVVATTFIALITVLAIAYYRHSHRNPTTCCNQKV
ncbi:MAG: MFS transporter, partial [Cellvibrionales bacterium]|nr:MFS transporter [Cellvibrionales bacterium]